MLIPLLYSLYTHECEAKHSYNPIYKFANITVTEWICMQETEQLVEWCRNNHLDINKTNDQITDIRKGMLGDHVPFSLMGL